MGGTQDAKKGHKRNTGTKLKKKIKWYVRRRPKRFGFCGTLSLKYNM